MHKHRTSDGLAILGSITGKNLKMLILIGEEAAKLGLAKAIYELRIKAGLSQTGLAKRIGTTQSVISRIEDADYDGHSLVMLQRIAGALNHRIEVRFVSLKPSAPRKARKKVRTPVLRMFKSTAHAAPMEVASQPALSGTKANLCYTRPDPIALKRKIRKIHSSISNISNMAKQ